MTQHIPKITIIIPAYNQGCYIADALNSILNQSFNNYEIIIVDDGSTDTTKAVVASYLTDERVSYIYQKNSGVASARNKGISMARGEYLCFLDADDELLPGSFQKRIAFFEAFPIFDVLIADYLLEDRNDIAPYSRLKKIVFLDFFSTAMEKIDQTGYRLNSDFLSTYLRFSFNPFHSSMITLRLESVRQIGGFRNISVAEDVDFCWRAIKNLKTGFLDEPLSIYRKVRGGTMSSKDNYITGLFFEIQLFGNELRHLDQRKHLKFALLLRKKISRNYFLISRYYLKRRPIDATICLWGSFKYISTYFSNTLRSILISILKKKAANV